MSDSPPTVFSQQRSASGFPVSPLAQPRHAQTLDGPVSEGGETASVVVLEPSVSKPLHGSWKAGSKLGEKYTMLRPLGAGGMGMVWVARNEATEAEVAIKLLLPGGVADKAEILARFRREAYATAKMRHRSIVRVYDLIELPAVEADESDAEQASVALVMELLDGQTLGGLLEQRTRLAPNEAAEIALALLSALAHAHDAGIIHRDLKPENVFLSTDTDGLVTPKILDFGISKLVVSSSPAITRDGETLGTPAYMSPEQARSGALDGRSDLFNVGILLYEMLTGRNPFSVEGDAVHNVIVAILEANPEPLPAHVPPALADVVMRALSKRPEERFAGAREMSAALRGAIDDPMTSSTPRLHVDSLGLGFAPIPLAPLSRDTPMQRVPSSADLSADASAPTMARSESLVDRFELGDGSAREQRRSPIPWRKKAGWMAAAGVLGLGALSFALPTASNGASHATMSSAEVTGPAQSASFTSPPRNVQALQTVDTLPSVATAAAAASAANAAAVTATAAPNAAFPPTVAAADSTAPRSASATPAPSGSAAAKGKKRGFYKEPGF